MPRRYHAYPEEFQVLNVLSTAGASILGVGFLLPVVYLLLVAQVRARSPAQPVGRDGPRVGDRLAAADRELRRDAGGHRRGLRLRGRGARLAAGHPARLGALSRRARTEETDLSTAHSTSLAHHFDDLEQQQESATLGMWLFLAQEIMFFGGLFMAYVVYRWRDPEAFAAGSHELDITLGLINTVVLIGSSLTMALAVRAAQTSRTQGRWCAGLVATGGLGLVFLGVKDFEYSAKFEHHLVPGPNFHSSSRRSAAAREIFFSLYFAMTGMHALHMIIGIGAAGLAAAARPRAGVFNAEYHNPVECFGLYWHFVDIVWIFLFPLLYLIGRHYHGGA